MTEEVKPPTVIGNMELTLNLTDRRGIKITSYLFLEEDADKLDKRIDFLQDRLDRQAIRVDIVSKEAQIVGHTENLKNIREAYDSLVGLQKQGKKLTSQQKNNVDNYERTVLKAVEMIDSLKAAVAEGKKKLNGSAVIG